MLEKRKAPRRKMVLPVKVAISKSTHLLHTLDITPTGARLGALRTELRLGSEVTLQRGAKKGTFKVVWLKQLSPTEIQVGVESEALPDNFWGVNLYENDSKKKGVRAFMSLLSDSKKKPDDAEIVYEVEEG